jgi:hypothetical protein
MYALEEIKNLKSLGIKIEKLKTLKKEVESDDDKNLSYIVHLVVGVIYGGILGLGFEYSVAGTFSSLCFYFIFSIIFQLLRNKSFLKKHGTISKFLNIKSNLFLNKTSLKKFQEELDEKPYFKKIINNLDELEYDKEEIVYMLIKERVEELDVRNLNNELEELEEIIEDLLPEKKVWELYSIINDKLDLSYTEETEAITYKKQKPKKRSLFIIKSI